LRTLPTPDAYWITDRLLAGEYPGAKDTAEARRKLERFLDAGVTTFIDLTEEDEYGLRPYAAAAGKLSAARGLPLTHLRWSIPDLTPPTPPQMSRILDAIDDALTAGQTVYVHCYGGIGRTGTVVGCWLVRHGLSGASALDQIAAWRRATPDGARPSPETAAQRTMVLNWPERLHA
jgi:predicted protein tyrosine phosphatase